MGSVGESRRIDRLSRKGIGARIGQRKIHFGCFCGSEILIGTGILNLVKGIPEHLVVGLLPVQQEVDGFPYLFIINLAVEIFINHLGPLLRGNVAEKIRTQSPVTVT